MVREYHIPFFQNKLNPSRRGTAGKFMRYQNYELFTGIDFSFQVVLGTELLIESSTAANPSVITIPNHGLSNAGLVHIYGHRSNTAINNTTDGGLSTVANATTNTFTSGAVGTCAGGASGTVIKPYDISTDTITCKMVNSIGTAGFSITPTITKTTPLGGLVTISLTAVQSATITQNLIFDIVRTVGGVKSIVFQGSITVAPVATLTT
jgi:hypothetical protein